jgi:hypothetical protein
VSKKGVFVLFLVGVLARSGIGVGPGSLSGVASDLGFGILRW